MNKYIVRTSLFWIALIAAVALFLMVRTRRRPPAEPGDLTVQPVAEGPSSGHTGRIVATASITTPELAPLQLSPERIQSIGVQTAVVEKAPITDEIRATGTVAINERLLSYVQVRFSGYIRQVFANAPLQFVRKGDPLFTIYSPELVAAENEYLVALRNKKRLQSSGIEEVASGASDLADSAEARLRQWDVPPNIIRQVQEAGAPVSELLVTAPASGYITERNALPNLYVEPATRLYTVADLSQVWVDAQLFPEDLGRVKPGDSAAITLDAYPGRTIRARVEAILPQVDMTTRTGRVRLALPNTGLRLKPGMYVNVALQVPLGTEITVPASAVLMTGTRAVAFLDNGNGQLQPKDVQPGQRVGDKLIVLGGLSPGQKIVSSANFLIDAESQLQAAAGAFTPSPPGASANASQHPRQQVQIEFATVPSPPRRGSNQFRVNVSDQQGKPVSDAGVTVVFYMAAMPAMGMAAMTTKSDLQPGAAGSYTGSGVLGSGGTWQVTIAVRRGGALLASKQLNLTATGGM